MPRFLHTADWQIGRQYGQFAADDAVPLAEARLAAVETIARLATAHRVDAVLVAGDVFDAQTVSDRTIRRLFQALDGFSGPWLMIPGNHDAALSESVWSRAARLGALPDHLHLALQPGVLAFPGLGFSALAAPLVQRHTYNDLTDWFDDAATADGQLRIGLAHGSVQGILAPDIDSANPIAADRAARARLDYLALGDWHGCRQVDARTWYSGTPEPDRFKGNEPGHALLVELEAPGAEAQVTRVVTGRFRWQAWEHELAVDSDVDAVVQRLAASAAHDVLSLSLRGRIDLAGLQRLQGSLGETEARVRSVLADLGGLRLLPTEADIAGLNADGYLGEVITELRARQGGAADTAGAAVAAQALALLAGILVERQGAPGMRA
jgi:DNA repair exonuclease SbcCD nuclease subunit